MTDPDHALECCRDIGFEEGAWIHDVRAGDCQIRRLEASVVVFACEDGQVLALDGATELLDSYRNDSIRLAEGEP
jgi:hypothetical protein